MNAAFTSTLGLLTAFWAIGFLARLAFFPASTGHDRWIIPFLFSILAVAAVCLLCGLAGCLTLRAASGAYLLLAIAMAAAAAAQRPRQRPPIKTRPSWAGLIAAVVLVLVAARAVSFPLTAWDTLMRYAQLGKLFAQTGRICYPPASPADWMLFSEPEAYPPLVPFLFAWSFLFSGGDWAARLISPLFLAMTCVAIAATAGVVSRQEKGAAGAALLFLSYPAVILHSIFQNGYADLPVLFFSVCCLYFAITLEQKRRGTLLLGCALGCALLTKYSALFLLPPILLTGLLTGTGKKASLAILLGIAIGLPWYLRSYLLTGNPFHPIFFTLFGDRTGAVDGMIYFDGFTRFTVSPSSVLREAALWTFGWNGSVIVSVAAFLQVARRRWDRVDVLLLVWLAASLGASLLMRRQEIRFGLFSLVVLSLLAARYLSGKPLPRATVLAAATILIFAQGSGMPLAPLFSENYFAGATLGQEEKKLAALGEDYAAWQYINSLPDDSIILTPDNRFYYIERKIISLKNPLVRPLLTERDAFRARKMLAKKGIGYIMVYDPAKSPIGGSLAARNSLLTSPALTSGGTLLISSERFRLLRTPSARTPGTAERL